MTDLLDTLDARRTLANVAGWSGKNELTPEDFHPWLEDVGAYFADCISAHPKLAARLRAAEAVCDMVEIGATTKQMKRTLDFWRQARGDNA